MISVSDELYSGTAKPESGGGTEINNEDITITQNGEYSASEGYTGIGTATVSVPSYDTITATNKTGAAITSGDKVYINKVGSDYVLTPLYTVSGGQKVVNPELKSSGSSLPTISSEFVASNFSDSANLGGTFYIPTINYGNFTIFMKAKMPSATSGTKTLLGGHVNLAYSAGSQKLESYNNASSSTVTLLSASRNTTYYIKINVNGTTRTFSISTDNENWTSESYTGVSLVGNTNIAMFYGYSPYASGTGLSTGNLSLEDIYIEDATSGQVLWRAVEEHISSQITPSTLTGYALANIADNATGNVKTIL